jgi:hypothetical protein
MKDGAHVALLHDTCLTAVKRGQICPFFIMATQCEKHLTALYDVVLGK